MKQGFVALILLFSHLIIHAQQNPPIKNLVFEGSGIRGIAYCGVISELESRNLLAGIEKVGGTSAGAITALTLSLGYSANEIKNIIGKTNFKKFNDGRYFLAGGINRTSKYFGWYRGKRFERWLEKLIEEKAGNADITFAGLRQKGFKELYVTGTSLNRQQVIVFSHQTYPNMKVKDAVRISMSIPLYFEAVFIDKEGRVIPRPKNKEGLDIMVDGGLTGNFPIRLFDSTNFINPGTLGFRVDNDEQIKYDREGKSLAPLQVNNFTEYINAFYNMVLENLNRQPLTKDDWKRTVSISDGKVRPRIRRMSEEEINILIENGRKALNDYLIK
jgi:NTE family protein